MGLRFSKMHGLGNDFVIVDCRERPLPLDVQAIRTLGDRHFGVGFDQLLTIERARDARCAFAYGVQTDIDARVAVHSLAGCFLYGAVAAKLIVVRSGRLPGWALPLAGGTLVALVAVLWYTSALWYFDDNSLP